MKFLLTSTRFTVPILGACVCAALSAQEAAPADRNAVNTAARPGGMMADSPVKFPEKGALPAMDSVRIIVASRA
jgi:hypothetical protein